MSEQAPVRDTEIPAHPAISTDALLGSGDVDRLSAMLHSLIEEVADLSVRLARVEAQVADQPEAAPHDLQAVQAHVAALITRITS